MRRNTWPKKPLLSEKSAEALGRSEASAGPPQPPDTHFVNIYSHKTGQTHGLRLTDVDTEKSLIEGSAEEKGTDSEN